MQRPDFLVVLRYQRPSDRGLIVPGDAEALHQIASGRAIVNHIERHNRPLALAGDAKLVTNATVPPIASGEQATADLLYLPVLRANRRRNAIRILLEALERPAEPELHQRRLEQDVSQNRLEHDLAQAHIRFQRLRTIVSGGNFLAPIVHIGITEASDFPLTQPGHPGNIHDVLARNSDVADSLGYSEPSEVLHAPTVGDIHLGMTRGRRIALNDQNPDTARLKLHRSRQPHGPCSDDQNRYLDHGSPPSGVRALRASLY